MQGSQSIQRAIALLRAVAERQGKGAKLTTLARQLGLNVDTARRILKALAEEGLLEYHEAEKSYCLGFELHRLGADAQRFKIREVFHSVLERLARQTEDTAFLVVRSGNDSVVIDRVEGAFPIRTLTHDIGQRVPLGVGAGSLALLASLPAEECEAVIKANADRYHKPYSQAPDQIRKLSEATRKNGIGMSTRVVMAEAIGVGVAVINHQGRAVAAVSVAAIYQRMHTERRQEIVQLIREEVARQTWPEEWD